MCSTFGRLNFQKYFNENCCRVILFSKDCLTISHIGKDKGSATTRRKTITQNNCGMVYWRIRASPGIDEFWINNGPHIGLLSDGTKPLLKPILTYHQCYLFGIHLRVFRQEKRYMLLIWVWKFIIYGHSLISQEPINWLFNIVQDSST